MTNTLPSTPTIAVSDRAKQIAARVSPERWERMVRDARHRCEILRAVEAKHTAGVSYRQGLRETAPEVGWSRYRHWCRRYDDKSAPGWESQLDERIPPEPVRVSEAVRKAACLLRRANPTINSEAVNKALVAEFGEEGDISATSLRRIWSAAGLSQPAGGNRPRTGGGGKRYDCGAGLAFIAAAEAETMSAHGVAAALAQEARQMAAQQDHTHVVADAKGRDKGRFTAAYNHNVRGGLQPGDMDPRMASDATKRSRRSLADIRTLELSSDNIADKLLAMGVTPLLTERHGFDGVDGPCGACLEVLGGHAYKAATLDKTLSEWAVLGVAEAMWSAHAQQWVGNVQRWSDSANAWQRLVVYVDGTQNPYWTRRYAVSGKVSGVGRVMPCLSQIAVSAGASPPLLICTLAGQASLKTALVPTLEKLDSIVGSGCVGRITVIDAEMGSAKTLSALAAMKPARLFVSVLKGHQNRTVRFQPTGEWQPYRTRDKLREGVVTLHGEGVAPEGMTLRAVEMARDGSRHPHSTIFISNSSVDTVSEDFLSTVELVNVYLSRWPNQEGDFRDRRNGGGSDRTHGYGGTFVDNVALDTDLDKVRRRVERAEARLADAESALNQANNRKEANTKAGKRDTVITKACHLAEKARVAAQKTVDRLRKELQAKETTPQRTFLRDTTRHSIATVAALTMVMLVEWVLKEYFGGLAMELRTYIELLINLPVTVTTSRQKVLYGIHANPRDLRHLKLLQDACSEINQRGLRRKGKLMVFEVLEPPGQ